MTALRYEDTVQPEIAPCADCGVLVEESQADWDGDDRRCEDCAVARGMETSGLPEHVVRKVMGYEG